MIFNIQTNFPMIYLMVLISLKCMNTNALSETGLAPSEWSTGPSFYDSVRCGLSFSYSSPPVVGDVPQPAEGDNDGPQWKVMGGRDTDDGDFPWAAAIFFSDWFRCSGTLISKKHVLTAAHCFVDSKETNCHKLRENEKCCRSPDEPMLKQFTVRLGSNCLRKDKRKKCNTTRDPRTFAIKRAVLQHYIDTKCGGNDYALLELTEEVPSDLANHICLPDMHPPVDHLIWSDLAGLELTSFGWGRDPLNHRPVGTMPVLQRLDMRGIWKRSKCREKIRKKFGVRFEEDMICTEEKEKANVCMGDSGGGLTVKWEGGGQFVGGSRWFLLGAVSFGVNCTALVDNSAEPIAQVYTNVSFHWKMVSKFLEISTPRKRNQWVAEDDYAPCDY